MTYILSNLDLDLDLDTVTFVLELDIDMVKTCILKIKFLAPVVQKL